MYELLLLFGSETKSLVLSQPLVYDIILLSSSKYRISNRRQSNNTWSQTLRPKKTLEEKHVVLELFTQKRRQRRNTWSQTLRPKKKARGKTRGLRTLQPKKTLEEKHVVHELFTQKQMLEQNSMVYELSSHKYAPEQKHVVYEFFSHKQELSQSNNTWSTNCSVTFGPDTFIYPAI